MVSAADFLLFREENTTRFCLGGRYFGLLPETIPLLNN